MARKLEVVIEAVTKGLESNLKSAEGRFKRVSHTAGVAGLALAGGLAVGLEKSVHAAMEAQTSQARLEAAFKASGVSAKAYEPQIKKLEAASRKLGFTEEDVHGSLGSLIIATHSYKNAAKDMSVAEDIARFKHINLEAATKMLTMAMAGSQRATKQLGLSVQATTEHADLAREAYKKQKDALDAQFPSIQKMTAAQREQFYAQRDNLDQQYAAAKASAVLEDKSVTSAKVIDLVTQKLHGQASAYADTAAGGMERFKAQLNFLEISIGTALIPIFAKAATELANLTEWFTKHHAATKLLLVATVALTGVLLTAAVATKVYEAAVVVARAVTAIWTGAQWALNAALAANPIALVVIAIAALAAGIVLAYKHSQTFRDIVQGALHAAAEAADFVGAHWRLMVAVLAGPEILVVIDHIHGIINVIKTLVDWIMTAIHAVEALINALKSIHVPHIHFPHIPGFASGVTNFSGGLAMVGEKGPELVALPGGASVIPNNKIGGGGATYVFNFPNYVGNRRELLDEMRNAAQLFKQQTGKAAFA